MKELVIGLLIGGALLAVVLRSGTAGAVDGVAAGQVAATLIALVALAVLAALVIAPLKLYGIHRELRAQTKLLAEIVAERKR